jgi:hypothetical protein
MSKTKTEPYRTPDCKAGERDPEFEFGHRKCQWPGYESLALGWVVVECACSCHTEVPQ